MTTNFDVGPVTFIILFKYCFFCQCLVELSLFSISREFIYFHFQPVLVQACFHGDADEIRSVLSKGEDVNYQVS